MELKAKGKGGLTEAPDPLMTLFLTELERSQLIHIFYQGVASESFHSAHMSGVKRANALLLFTEATRR
jgi:hypothetical protein